jgi:WD40 repeat protein
MGNKSGKGDAGASEGQQVGSRAGANKLPVTSADFFVRQVGHHGLPEGVRSLAYCPVQGLIAVGTDTGVIKVFGKPGVEATFINPGFKSAATFLLFSHTGSTLIVVYANTLIRLFDIKKQRTRAELKPGWTGAMVSATHLCPAEASAPFLYLGTDEGSLHVLNLMKMEFSDYFISGEQFGIETDDDDNDNEIIGIATNPEDMGEILVAHEFGGIALWNISKRRCEKRYICPKEVLRGTASDSGNRRGSFHGIQVPSLASIAWHPNGHQFVAGYVNGVVVVYDASHKGSGKVQPIHFDEISMPKRLTSVLWATDMRAKNGPGHLVVCGGHETCGVTILSRNTMHKKSLSANDWVCGDVALPMTEDGPVLSSLMPTWDSSPIMKLLLTYPPKCDPSEMPNGASHHPSGYIALAGDPQDGIHPRLYIQALPSQLNDTFAQWPPIACDPPEPTPELLHFPSPLRRSMVIVMKDCGLCPNPVLEAIKRASPPPKYASNEPHWEHPVRGGAYESGQSGRRSLVASGHVDGTLCLWAAAAPTDGVSVELEEEGVVNSSLDLLYEFEPRLLCEAEGYKSPLRPAITALELHLPARVLCVGTESGDILICAVKPPSAAVSANGQTEVQTRVGSAVFLMNCIQDVHTSRIVGLSLHAETGLLAVVDSSGKGSILDVDNGKLINISIPQPPGLTFGKNSNRNDGPIRAVETANLPDENGLFVPVVLLGMANGYVAICHLRDGSPSILISGADHSDPVTQILVIDEKGLAPLPTKASKRYRKISADVSPDENPDSKLPATKEESGAGDSLASQGEGDEGDGGNEKRVIHRAKTSTGATEPLLATLQKPEHHRAHSDIAGGAASKASSAQAPRARRFGVIVAGHDIRVYQLVAGNADSRLRTVKAKSLAEAELDGTTVASGACVVLGNETGEVKSARVLLCVDNMNNATVLSLPRLKVIVQERLPTVSVSDYLRHVAVVDSGDVFLVTELSVIHRMALASLPTLGIGKEPTLTVEPLDGSLAMSTASKVAANKSKSKKSVFGNMFGSKNVDLNKIFATTSTEARQEASVSELLGSIPDHLGEPPSNISATKSAENQISGTKDIMAQNMRKLEERGEKLADIQEATSKMMLNAMRFEEESRQIRRQAEKDAECTIS